MMDAMQHLRERYDQQVKKELCQQFDYDNPLLIPRLKKIVISMGLATVGKDKQLLAQHAQEMALLSGQQPVVTRARKSISNFKLRKGQIVGLKVTLRRKRMYDFFSRFCHIITPRIRDFRGFPARGDGRGCYCCGIEDQQIFPEIDLDAIQRGQGMHLAFVTSATTDRECIALLAGLGFPFRK